MEPDHRLYLCARCRDQVVICSCCDRGQRYCSDACRAAVRGQQLREAGQRYQRSRRGQLRHVRRALVRAGLPEPTRVVWWTPSWLAMVPTGQRSTVPTPGLLGGNSYARPDPIYGRLDCSAALRALKSGDTFKKARVFFADEATAKKCGYRPCGACMKPEYKLWIAKQSDAGT